MLRKRWQPRRLRASFPPMPSPATSDRRAASYLARLREWRRQDQTSLLHRSGSTRVSSSRSTSAAAAPERPLQRRQTAERIIAHGYRRDHLHDRLLAASREARRRKAGARFLTVRFVRGSGGAPRSYAPMAVAGKLSEPRRLRRYLRRKLRAPKHLRVGEEWAGTDILRTTVLRARNSMPHARSSYNLLHCNHGLRGK